jgi:hypothetical protein
MLASRACLVQAKLPEPGAVLGSGSIPQTRRSSAVRTGWRPDAADDAGFGGDRLVAHLAQSRVAQRLLPELRCCRVLRPDAEAVAGQVLRDAPPSADSLGGERGCRYAGQDGVVRIGVRVYGSRISLTVEDSGPGIAEAERPRLFDRFHRATEQGSGAGLGLAIGDSIVRSTGGRWHIGDSPLGGALMMVIWKRHSTPHRLAAQRMTTGGPGVSAMPGREAGRPA